MIYKVVGKEIASGEYNGRPYENLRLYCTTDAKGNDTFEGQKVEVVKIKRDCKQWYNDLSVGDSFRAFYDRYGNVEEISLQD